MAAQEFKMAKSIKLPLLKVRHKSTSGDITYRAVPRITFSLKREAPVTYEDAAPKRERTIDNDDVSLDLPDDDYGMATCTDDLPSLYAVKQKIAASAWSTIRNKLRDACVEISALPEMQMCVKCLEVSATLRCRRCGPCAYFCDECWLSCHSQQLNVFHIPEIWKVQAVAVLANI